jgi:hypothetical protein
MFTNVANVVINSFVFPFVFFCFFCGLCLVFLVLNLITCKYTIKLLLQLFVFRVDITISNNLFKIFRNFICSLKNFL